MRKTGREVLLLWCGLPILLFALHSFAQPREPISNLPPLPGRVERPSFGPPPSSPSIEKIRPGLFRFGSIEIDKNEKAVRFSAQVNMNKGLLEYLLVRTSGKVHESLLRTSVEPYHLQIALLLLGVEGTDRPLTFQGDLEKPTGEPVEILLSTAGLGERSGVSAWIKAENWVMKKVDGRLEDLPNLDWVYTGSTIVQGQFLAQGEGSFIALYHDPAALIDNASPGGESDDIWFVKEGVVPPVGTSVVVMIRTRR